MESVVEAIFRADNALFQCGPLILLYKLSSVADLPVTVVWGILALCQCAAKNFGGMLAIRIILG